MFLYEKDIEEDENTNVMSTDVYREYRCVSHVSVTFQSRFSHVPVTLHRSHYLCFFHVHPVPAMSHAVQTLTIVSFSSEIYKSQD